MLNNTLTKSLVNAYACCVVNREVRQEFWRSLQPGKIMPILLLNALGRRQVQGQEHVELYGVVCISLCKF